MALSSKQLRLLGALGWFRKAGRKAATITDAVRGTQTGQVVEALGENMVREGEWQSPINVARGQIGQNVVAAKKVIDQISNEAKNKLGRTVIKIQKKFRKNPAVTFSAGLAGGIGGTVTEAGARLSKVGVQMAAQGANSAKIGAAYAVIEHEIKKPMLPFLKSAAIAQKKKTLQGRAIKNINKVAGSIRRYVAKATGEEVLDTAPKISKELFKKRSSILANHIQVREAQLEDLTKKIADAAHSADKIALGEQKDIIEQKLVVAKKIAAKLRTASVAPVIRKTRRTTREAIEAGKTFRKSVIGDIATKHNEAATTRLIAKGYLDKIDSDLRQAEDTVTSFLSRKKTSGNIAKLDRARLRVSELKPQFERAKEQYKTASAAFNDADKKLIEVSKSFKKQQDDAFTLARKADAGQITALTEGPYKDYSKKLYETFRAKRQRRLGGTEQKIAPLLVLGGSSVVAGTIAGKSFKERLRQSYKKKQQEKSDKYIKTHISKWVDSSFPGMPWYEKEELINERLRNIKSVSSANASYRDLGEILSQVTKFNNKSQGVDFDLVPIKQRASVNTPKTTTLASIRAKVTGLRSVLTGKPAKKFKVKKKK